MVSDRLKYQRNMDRALERDLTEPEWEALQTHFGESPQSADYWERLQQVDWLLDTTPLVVPSPGFASRVMAAIAAMPLPAFANRKIGLGLALGLLAVAFLTVPVLSGALLVLLSAITNPGTINTILQGATSGISYLADLIRNLVQELRTVAVDTPMIPALLMTAIPLSMVWVWLVWHLSGGSRFFSKHRLT